MAAEDSAAARGLDEIRSVLADLPGPDLEAGTAALTRCSELERSVGALGRLGEHVEWLATWQGHYPPSLGRPRIAVFAGNHGLAIDSARNGRKGPAETFVENAVSGGEPVNAVCTVADADLRVFEMSLETPTRNAAHEPATTEEECARAIAYGMMAVEQGLDLICLDSVGAGSDVAAAAANLALFGGTAHDWIADPAAGDAADHRSTVDAISAFHRDAGDPFEVLRRIGGFEMCAVLGAVIAARLARTPVVLGGYAATAAAAVLFAVDRHFLDHCRAAHLPRTGSGLRRLQERLGLQPLTDFGSSVGGGTEAGLAIPFLKAAVEVHVATAPAVR